ncbi:MAG TPA: type II secretion system F family protein [Candidatus Omnitrophota bacterium]|nr:type II secretion system F family protein [Candidatus Omnitrophota bacterium]
MKTFRYKARKGLQETVEGTIEAKSRDEAIVLLTREGLFPLDVIQEKSEQPFHASIPSLLGISKISSRDKIAFLERLADLTEAGLTIFRALEILSNQPQNPLLRNTLIDVKESIRTGKSLSDAMEKHPECFSPFVMSMVRAGEQSGTLDNALRECAQALEREYEMRQKVAQAFVYPSMILSFGFLTVLVLLFFVIPRLEEIFQDLGGSLPFITRFFVFLSRVLTRFGWLFAGIILSCGIYLKNRAKKQKEKSGTFFEKIPWLGQFRRIEDTVYFTRTLGLLLGHGISIIEALTVASQVIRSAGLRKKIVEIKGSVIQGASLARAIEEHKTFDVLVLNFVQTGEESGTLDKTLQKLSGIYEKQLEHLIKISTTLVEPLLILLIGVLVGMIVVSMLLPIFEISLLVH